MENKKKKKIAVICSHGGHLTETLQIIDAFNEFDFFFVTHFSARDKDIKAITTTYLCQNIGARPLRLIRTVFWALPIIVKENPDIILSLGAEIAIPFYFWGYIFGKKTIFIESWCRVNKLSKTGKLVYPFVNEFWVQWPQLLSKRLKKAKFMGSVI